MDSGNIAETNNPLKQHKSTVDLDSIIILRVPVGADNVLKREFS